MAITDWPADERPREKLLARGASALSDAELLAIFLRTGVRGKTAVDLARELLLRFAGLRGLLAARRETFCEAHGLGEAKYVQLQAVTEIARRSLAEALEDRPLLQNPLLVRQFLQAQLRDREHEIFAALFLDNQHRLLKFQTLAEGTIDGAAVYVREVVKAAIRLGASAVIFAHNHPSGIAEASAADRMLTERLVLGLRTVDVRVLDHFIVGDGPPFSFAEHGMM